MLLTLINDILDMSKIESGKMEIVPMEYETGAMFSDLVKFQTDRYMENHPSAYIVTDNGVYRYDFFSAYKASVKSITYGMKMQTAKKRNELIQFNLNYGVAKSDLVPNIDDHLLTLSTCSGFGHTARWVVVGVLNEEGSCLLNELP